MSDETRIRVRLDTTQASAELSKLEKQGEKTATGVSKKIRSKVLAGLGGFGIGAATGAAVSAIQSPTSGGLSDVVSEALGGYGASLSQALLGDLPDKATAARQAREETIQAFGAIAGATGEIPPGTEQFFNAVSKIREDEATGRRMFESDSRFRGPEVTDLLKRVIEPITDAIGTGFDKLISSINPFSK